MYPARLLHSVQEVHIASEFLFYTAIFVSIIQYCFGMFLLRLGIIAVILVMLGDLVFFQTQKKNSDRKISKQVHFVRESNLKVIVLHFVLLCNLGKTLLKVAFSSSI